METYLVKVASSGISMLFTQMKQTSEQHIEFIDPLCSIIKLCTLHYKPNGTKFSIKNNTITLQEAGVLQGFQRWMNKDERDQLHHLKLPIFYFKGITSGFITIEHFDLHTIDLTHINNLAIKGLKKLKMSYMTDKPGSLIKNCLDDYITTLSSSYTIDEYMTHMQELNKPILFAIYGEYSKLWRNEDFKIIIDLFRMSDQKDDPQLHNILANCVDCFITFKDKELDTIRPN
jgi:hypothetical protein